MPICPFIGLSVYRRRPEKTGCATTLRVQICIEFVKLAFDLVLTCMGLGWIVCLHLSLSQGVFDRSMLTKQCRCFDTDTDGADGAADLLEALSQSTQLENLGLQDCNQIPTGGVAESS